MVHSRVLVLLLLAGCTDALLQPVAVEETALDDRLSIRGKVCTGTPSPANFPVKVVFLVDKSGSMCVSDGPGSQDDNGFCQQVADRLGIAAEVPGRVRALKELMARFARQSNVSVALVPFESQIVDDFPRFADGQFFVPARDLGDARIENLQAKLGKGTDYQGALAHAFTRIEADINASNPQVLPRTRYVVILLTDGAPYPRCAADDSMPEGQYAGADNPWAIWQDNPPDFCNANDAGEVIDGFIGGAERNQNYQLFDAVDRLMDLKQKRNIGDLRLHTILLFNQGAVEACGELCSADLYNGLEAADARAVATWTLTEIAEVHGGGTFQEFTDTASIELGALDYTSLASRLAVKTLFAENTNAVPGRGGPRLDSDGDRVPDDEDAKAVRGTEKLDPDSDGDGFSDSFELARAAETFDPLAPDPRGCRTTDEVEARYSCADSDGDGLSQAAEAYLGTDETLFDTDADGIPDGVEVSLGLDPLVPNDRVLDHDLDGVPDLTEVAQHTHPLLDDRAVHAREAYRYEIQATPQENGSVCYDFLVSNIRLLTPQRSSGQIGYNLITLTFGEAPESNVTRDYGVWRKACVFAQFAPPSVRVPAGPEIVLEPEDFHRPDRIRSNNLESVCKGVAP